MLSFYKKSLFSLMLLFSSSCAYAYELDFSQDYYKDVFAEDGTASWYGPRFHGRLTANGERYNQYGFTAAHKSLKFNIVLNIHNVKTGKNVLVQINDRGPYVGTRIIDLSEAAMKSLDGMKEGVITMRATAVSDAKGVPLDPHLTYYIKCSETSTLEEAQKEIDKLYKVGIYEAHLYHIQDKDSPYYFVGIGPFEDFKVAQDSLIDHVTIFPQATINLIPRNVEQIK